MYVEYREKKSIIHWEPTDGETTLYKSGAPHEDFEEVAKVDLSTGQYVDEINSVTNSILYYRLGDQLLHFHNNPNAYAKEIVRRDRWFLANERYSGGTEAYIWIKNNRSDDCEECYDSDRQRQIKSNCKTCFGTGLEKPYYSAFKIYIDVRPSAKRLHPQFENNSDKNKQQAFWTSNLPIIKPLDLIYFNGEIFRVLGDNINQTRVGKYITKQQVTMEGIEQHRPEYGLTLEEGGHIEELQYQVWDY